MEEYRLKEFISVFWSYQYEKIDINHTLDDLGMYGDDKRDFLENYFIKFNIDSTNMIYENYCEVEGFNPFSIFYKNKQKSKISIQHLLDVIKAGKWYDPQ